MMNNNTIFVLGNNDSYQLGVRRPSLINELTPITLPLPVREIVCGLSHTLFHMCDDTIMVVGQNSKGQCECELT
jgi:alpha-tubulin suppressor-like RCC1 family protein